MLLLILITYTTVSAQKMDSVIPLVLDSSCELTNTSGNNITSERKVIAEHQMQITKYAQQNHTHTHTHLRSFPALSRTLGQC